MFCLYLIVSPFIEYITEKPDISIEVLGKTSSQESDSHSSDGSESDDLNKFAKTLTKVDFTQKLNRKLTRGLYVRKGYVSDEPP